jgi:hypothetical protein
MKSRNERCSAFQSEKMMFGLSGKRRCFQRLDAHSRFISTVVLTILLKIQDLLKRIVRRRTSEAARYGRVPYVAAFQIGDPNDPGRSLT